MATRIYQGRITSARFEDDSITANPYEALADTHRLFQDAVNYHIVALAGMADDTDHATVGGRFRQQVKDIWNEHPKGNPQATTLAQSVCRTLNLKNATFEEAVADLFDGCERPDILPYALQFVLDKTEKGEGVIQQQGSGLLPKLCNPDFAGNFDYSSKEKSASEGLAKLTEICQRENVTEDEYVQFAASMSATRRSQWNNMAGAVGGGVCCPPRVCHSPKSVEQYGGESICAIIPPFARATRRSQRNDMAVFYGDDTGDMTDECHSPKSVERYGGWSYINTKRRVSGSHSLKPPEQYNKNV